MFEILQPAVALALGAAAILLVARQRLDSRSPEDDRVAAAEPERMSITSRRSRCTCGHAQVGHPCLAAGCGCGQFSYAGGLVAPAFILPAKPQLEPDLPWKRRERIGVIDTRA